MAGLAHQVGRPCGNRTRTVGGEGRSEPVDIARQWKQAGGRASWGLQVGRLGPGELPGSYRHHLRTRPLAQRGVPGS